MEPISRARIIRSLTENQFPREYPDATLLPGRTIENEIKRLHPIGDEKSAIPRPIKDTESVNKTRESFSLTLVLSIEVYYRALKESEKDFDFDSSNSSIYRIIDVCVRSIIILICAG